MILSLGLYVVTAIVNYYMATLEPWKGTKKLFTSSTRQISNTPFLGFAD